MLHVFARSGKCIGNHCKLHKVAALMISYKQQVALRAPCFHFRTTRLSVKIRHDHNSCIGLTACWISDLSGYRSTVLFI